MASVQRDHSAQRSISVLRALFGERLGQEIGVHLWDGTEIRSARSAIELRLNEPFALRAALTPPLDLNPARAFVEGWLDVAGSLDTALDVIERSAVRMSALARVHLAAQIARLPAPPRADAVRRAPLRGRRHTKARDAAAIGFHYDQPVEFYRTFLGNELVYSCAYWDEGVTMLDEAQRAKLDYVLDKLRVRPGSTLLDIGCGWGALVMRAAQRGVHAYGITLSRAQYEEAQRRIEAAGLHDGAQVALRDYRELGDEQFDAVASVGMVEHVGRERLPEYFGCAFRALREGGLFLNHGIVTQVGYGDGNRAANDFIGRYVFPDADLTPIDTTIKAAAAAGFEVRDVENLREHYARTLRAWVDNLTVRQDEAIGVTDERTERIWRIYMTGSARGFASGRMGLMQTLLGKPGPAGVTDVPPTRRDLYRTKMDG